MNLRLSAFLATTAAVSVTQADPVDVFVPPASVAHASEAGRTMHTNHLIYTGVWTPVDPDASQVVAVHGPSLFRAFSSPSGYNPTELRSAYGDSGSGGGAIAIVDAYNYNTALNDFNVFSGQFGLPKETSTNVTSSSNKVFEIVYASGSKPAGNAGWNEEEALDIEWSHAMAPSAKIYLVEATNTTDSALFAAISKAASLSGVTQVSMSWGGGEFSTESSYDSYFSNAAVTYFASAGDSAVQEYPSESPKVVGVGGTTLTLSGGGYGSESGWSDSGGGPSKYESIPSFQSSISSIVGTKRGAPDIAADANPNTGVAVYDSTPYFGYVGWLVFGGTSVASPVCAGIANAGGAARGSGELSHIYGNTGGFHDVTTGGTSHYKCTTGWDFVTGWGSPVSTSSF